MAEKVTYLGPSDVFIVDDKPFYRRKGGDGATLNAETGQYEIDVPISADLARHMTAWGANHQFRIGDKIVREQAGGDAVRSGSVAATPEMVEGAQQAWTGVGNVVEADEHPAEPKAARKAEK